MSSDVEDKLCSELRSTHFAIQLDESTLRDSEALLLCYVRFIRDQEMVEEMLFARSLHTDTMGYSIFQTLERCFTDTNIPMENILACATDRAPAMVGRQRGFIALLKNQVQSVFAIHCVVHHQHFVAKALSTRLHTSRQTVIKAVNKIKVSSLHDRLFRQLCQENDEAFERLLLHTEVRWLSKGACLTRFHALFSTVVEFLSEIDTELSEKVNAIEHDAYWSLNTRLLHDKKFNDAFRVVWEKIRSSRPEYDKQNIDEVGRGSCDQLIWAKKAVLAETNVDNEVIQELIAGLPSVEEDERCMLDSPILAEELEAAVRSLKDGKASGIDGLPAEFYKTFWALAAVSAETTFR
uniref:protein FAM200C-like n=1 Tax=Myxine glutinosa TaxID=7769 RepID=UPI00358FE40F